MDFTPVLDGKIFASSRPWNKEHLKLMKKIGVKAVLNLLTEDEKAISDQEYLSEGFDYLNLPIEDMTAPTVEQLLKAVKWIDKKLNEGKKVLVHCYAGLGRTGTIIAAYLIYKGMEPEEAIEYIRNLRPGSIQTIQQELSLYIFKKVLDEEISPNNRQKQQ